MRKEITPAQLDKLVEVVDNSISWERLERLLVEENVLGLPDRTRVSLKSPAVFYLFVAGYYSYANPREVVEHSQQTNLPGTVVSKDGINYVLHGIDHTIHHRQVLRECLSDLELVVGEPGMHNLYRGANYVEQPRADEIKYIQNMGAYLLKQEFSSLLNGISSLPGVTASLLFPKFRQKRIEDIANYRVAMGSRSQEKEISLEQFNLPSHLEGDFIYTQLRRNNFESFSTLRSLSQAEFLERKSKERGVNEAHWSGGAFHEPQIAYFLRNPRFAQELRDTYSKQPDRVYAPSHAITVLAFATLPLITAASLSLKYGFSNLDERALMVAYGIAGAPLAIGLGYFAKSLRRVSTGYK